MHLQRPAGRERHERRPVLAGEDHALGALLDLEDAREQVGPEALDLVEEACGARRDVGVGVDLAVGVVQGDADGLAPILEREDLLHPGQRRERGRAIGPRLDDGAHPRYGET